MTTMEFFLCFCFDVSLCEYNLYSQSKDKKGNTKIEWFEKTLENFIGYVAITKIWYFLFRFVFVFITTSIFHISQSHMKCAQAQHQQQQQKVDKQTNKQVFLAQCQRGIIQVKTAWLWQKCFNGRRCNFIYRVARNSKSDKKVCGYLAEIRCSAIALTFQRRAGRNVQI